MRYAWFVAAAAGAAFGFAQAQARGQDEAAVSPADVKAGYTAALASVRDAAAKKLAKLPDEYSRMLEALQKTLQTQGDLDGVLGVRNEIARFQKDKKVPESDVLDDHIQVVDARQKYRASAARMTSDRDREIAVAFQQYTNRLAALKRQLTVDGKIDAAIEAQKEEERARGSPEAAISLAVAQATAAGTADKTARTEAAATGHSTVEALLDSERIEAFELNGWQLGIPAEVVNRLIEQVHPKGIRVRVDAIDALRIRGMSAQNGVPRYSPGSSGSGGSRIEPISLRNQTARSVVKAVCDRLGVSFRVDAARNEVVLFDRKDCEARKAVDTASLLDTVKLSGFTFASWEVCSPSSIVNKFIDAVQPKGIRVRVDADKLNVLSWWYDGKLARYTCGNVSRSERESRSYELSTASAKEALQCIGVVLGLGYKVDPDTQEVVILDNTAKDAQWRAEDVTVEQILATPKMDAPRKDYAGRSLLVVGNIARMGQGLSELSVNLDGGARLVFLKDDAGRTQFEALRSKFGENEKRNRSLRSNSVKTEVAAMGEVSAEPISRTVSIVNCRVLSVADRYVTEMDPAKKLHKLGVL